VMITPRRLEKLSTPLPDPAAANERLEEYVAVLRRAAVKRKYCLVDLFEGWKPNASRPLTDNGLHLTEAGYEEMAVAVLKSLGLKPISGQNASLVALRQAINAKNELYFHRWRPQNETYLFGFRKHEQGNNAREIPLFDPLVAAKEAEIARLKVPIAHTYEIRRKRDE
jgi:hypothetical protein